MSNGRTCYICGADRHRTCVRCRKDVCVDHLATLSICDRCHRRRSAMTGEASMTPEARSD